MAGTIRGKIECLHVSGNTQNQGQTYFTAVYKFLKQLEVAGVTTEIARHGGLSSTAANVNYYDEASPFLTNAWYVFRFNTNGSRTWPWYVFVQWAWGGTSDFGAAPGNPGLIQNSSTLPIATEVAVAVQCAIGFGGDENPWNGTTGAQASKGSVVWRVPANGGTNVAVFPRSNSPDWTHGRRAMGQIMAVAGSQLIAGETFTIGDGLTTARVFEFDFGGGVTPGNVAVAVTVGMTRYDVRDAIISAINGIHGVTDFYIVASIGGGEVVTLQNRQPGTIGNISITETVADAGFLVAGMAGGTGLVQNCRPVYFTGATSNNRCHFLADDDSIMLLLDPGADGSYRGFYAGVWTPRTSLVTTHPFAVLSGDLPVSEAWLGGDVNGDAATGTDVGMAVVNSDTGGRVLGVCRYAEVWQRQPNTQYSPVSYNDFPVALAIGEYSSVQSSSWVSFLGKFSTNMLREVYNIPTHDTNADLTRAIFGSATLADSQWCVPWDGVTVPGTGITRDGVTF
jgi:hypothetical protein